MSISSWEFKLVITTFITTVILAIGIFTAVQNTQHVARLAKDIQSQRRESVIRSCQVTNSRYRHAIAELDRIEREALKSSPQAVVKLFKSAGLKITNQQPIIEVERASIRGSLQQDKLLIRAVLPYMPNCKAEANKKVRPTALTLDNRANASAEQ